MNSISLNTPGKLLAGLVLILALGHVRASGQTAPSSTASPSLSQQTTENKPGGPRTYTLRVESHEVLIEVIATDQHNRPVRDLKETDFEIFEVLGKTRSPQKITMLHVVDPAAPEQPADSQPSDFRVTLGGTCAMGMVFHYQLAYHATSEGWTSGYHEILVTSGRPHVRLSFHRRYYVGTTYVPSQPRRQDTAKTDAALQRAACYHADTPASISLTARLIETGNTSRFRYLLSVQADSLAFISVSDEAQRVQLDYGVCTFDRSGNPLRYMHTSAERVLGAEEYDQVRSRGFPYGVEFSSAGLPALARFVVRDRQTGNLGSTEVLISPTVPIALTQEQKEAAEQRKARQIDVASNLPSRGPVGSFGSIVPQPGSMCGDVYELPPSTAALPDFWNLDSDGALYTYLLDVPNHLIEDATGVPGVLNRLEWFGVDYYGEFWTTTPGEYRFSLTSDDGARLFIDDDLILNLDGVHGALTQEAKIDLAPGRHTIHVPYFQGPLQLWALLLAVKAPSEQYKIFDLRDFPPPPDFHVQSRVLPGYVTIPTQK